MDINYEDVFPSSKKEIGQMDVAVEEEELIRESIRRIILEADGFQCNSHSLGFVDDQGNWLDTEGADHSDYLWANVYDMEDNRPGGYPMPDGWIKVSNASQIFFGGNSWDEVTPQQINGLIEMWGACSKYSRWIRKETESFEVIFGLIGPNRRMSNLEEMTIPEFLGKYGGRRAIENFYGMLLGENKRSTKRIISEVSEFGCNKHSLGFIDDKGDLIEAQSLNSNYPETHADILDRLGFHEDDIFDTPSGWIKVSNANELWFGGADWHDMTFAQFEGLVDMWSSCKRYSRWLQNDTDNFHVIFGTLNPESMEEYTIPEFIDKYVGRRGEDLFYGMLLGEL